MKRRIIPAIITALISISSIIVFAQNEKLENKKSREIIIRSDGDKDDKMKIEIDGENIMVNGKPLADYHNDDVTIIKKYRTDKNSHDFMFSPPDENDHNFEIFNNDSQSFGPRTFLGVITEKSKEGVEIKEVVKGSNAEKSGLKKGDIITKVDSKNISEPGELMDVVRSYKPNNEVKIYYKRNGSENDMKIKLGETKESKTTFVFNDNKNFRNENGFNFKTLPMPPMADFPNNFHQYFNLNNFKLGVKVEDTEDNNGAKILNVEASSAADKAGLKKDDIITEMNNEKVTGVDDVRSKLMNAESDGNYKLKAKRNNAEMNFELKFPKQVNSADL